MFSKFAYRCSGLYEYNVPMAILNNSIAHKVWIGSIKLPLFIHIQEVPFRGTFQYEVLVTDNEYPCLTFGETLFVARFVTRSARVASQKAKQLAKKFSAKIKAH